MTYHNCSLAAVLLACEPHINDLVRYRMSSVVRAGINSVDMIGTTADWIFFDQSETHVRSGSIGRTRRVVDGVDNR